LQVIDKIEREKPEALAVKLEKFGLTEVEVREFINNPDNASDAFKQIEADLTARGLGDYIELDLTIVRGLAYYTGTVFEIFDKGRSMRAIAGGGRYDDLLKVISNGSADLPCTGFAMGDVVIRNFIEETPHALMQMEAWLQRQTPCELYSLIVGSEYPELKLRNLEMRNEETIHPNSDLIDIVQTRLSGDDGPVIC